MFQGMSKVTVTVLLAVCFALGLSPFWRWTWAEEVVNWKLQSVFQTPQTLGYVNAFIENVKNKSRGKLIIKAYSSDQLVKNAGLLEAVTKGAIEIGWSTAPYNMGTIPEAAVEFGLPFTWESWSEQKEVFHSYGMLEKLREAYAEKGLYFLSPHPAGPFILMTKKRLDTLDDIKGLKIRVRGMEAKIIESLGASPSAIPPAEQYMALQRGTIDGTVYVGLALDQLKFHEVIDYVYFPAFTKPTTNLFVNLKAWNGLSEDLKRVFQESIDEILDTMNEGYEREDALGLMRSLMQGGLKGAIRFSDADVARLRKASMAVWDEVAGKNARCKEMVDMVKKFMKEKGKM